jgi:(R,R)-butanediol dehydrogenase / meso-butanediol dehydrogenase / diacetyl reductase
VAVECSGAERAFTLCVDAVRAGGTVAQTAIHVGPRTVRLDELTLRDITIAGSWSFNYYDTPRLLAQIAAGRLPVERVVTRRIGIGEIVAEGIEALGDPDGSEIKVLVDATREAD